MTEASELRENEPHPMGSLTPGGQFLNDLAIDRGLSVHEGKEISFGHRLPQFVRLNHRTSTKPNPEWTPVPNDKTNNVVAPDGGAHVCAPRQVGPNKGMLFCVVLPPEG